MKQELLRNIPKMDVMLNSGRLKELASKHHYAMVKDALRECLEELRSGVIRGSVTDLPGGEEICLMVEKRLEAGRSLRRVINGSGVILHTNLGRAPLGEETGKYLRETASGYCSLEYDLEEGTRGSRAAYVEKLLCSLTGAEDAMVVNNNAGAVFLMLNTLAKGKKTAISRGELVEIGGSFRIPEIMKESGTDLVEIGTTNKTHPADYERAVSEEGASVIMKVHRSNFMITGFTESVGIPELAELARRTGSVLLYDCGAAFLIPPESMGIHAGVDAGRAIREGADVICFSGDKLLGSAQSGIIAGKKQYIEKIRNNQLSRMLRIDKLSLAALETVLPYFRDSACACEKIPVLKMLSMPASECERRAETLKKMIDEAAPAADTVVCTHEDEIGGGALPGVLLPGAAVSAAVGGLTAGELEKKLRDYAVPVIARVKEDRVLISARTLFDRDMQDIAAAFSSISGRVRKEEA